MDSIQNIYVTKKGGLNDSLLNISLYKGAGND